MHKLNNALVSWRNNVKEVLESEGITYFNCTMKVSSTEEVPTFSVWFSLPGKNNYSFNSSEITGADPDEVINELIHRVQFQRRQSIVALPPVNKE